MMLVIICFSMVASLNDARSILLESEEIEGLAEIRLSNFIDASGALVIECGEHLGVSDLLKQYFSNKAPFSDSGKKKNEFPDAIILMAVEEWVEKNDKSVLAVALDDDWSKYCETSKRLDCIKGLSDGLALFNKANAPYAFLSRLELALVSETAQPFLDKIESHLSIALDGFTLSARQKVRFQSLPKPVTGNLKGSRV